MSEQLPGTTPTASNNAGEGWHLDHRPSRILTLGATSILGGILLLAAFGAARAQLWLATGLLVAVGVAVLLLSAGRDTTPRPPRLFTPPADPLEPPAPGTGTGVLLPKRPLRWATLYAWGVLGLLLAVSGVGVAVEAAIASRPGEVLQGLFPGGIGALLLLGTYAGVSNRRAPHAGLFLRPDAVELRTEATHLTLPWDTITGFRPHWTKAKSRHGATVAVNNWLSVETTLELTTEETTGLSMLARTGTTPVLDIDMLAAPPLDVLAVCRFYLEHPERRAELGTERGLTTIQRWEQPR